MVKKDGGSQDGGEISIYSEFPKRQIMFSDKIPNPFQVILG
jgi:hypothetical protein